MIGDTAVVTASSGTQHCVNSFYQGTKDALFTKAVLDFQQPKLLNGATNLFDDNQGQSRWHKTQSVGDGRSTLTIVIT